MSSREYAMRVALHDSDETNFPNLVLMKLAAWHKAQGDDVSWFVPNEKLRYDRVYSSKVFTFTPEQILPPGAIKGGTGYGMSLNLPDEIEHICPDYDIYRNMSVKLGKKGLAMKGISLGEKLDDGRTAADLLATAQGVPGIVARAA